MKYSEMLKDPRWQRCCHCKELLPETCFYRDKSKPSGRKPRCKKCEREYIDKDNRRKYEKNYQQLKPEKRREIMRGWYERNKDHHQRVQDRYRKTEQFKANHRNHAAIRRSRVKGNEYENIDFISIYKEHPYCFYCGKHLSFQEVEFDHFIPVSKGGPHTSNNIRVSCMPCNRRKGAMTYQVV